MTQSAPVNLQDIINQLVRAAQALQTDRFNCIVPNAVVQEMRQLPNSVYQRSLYYDRHGNRWHGWRYYAIEGVEIRQEGITVAVNATSRAACGLEPHEFWVEEVERERYREPERSAERKRKRENLGWHTPTECRAWAREVVQQELHLELPPGESTLIQFEYAHDCWEDLEKLDFKKWLETRKSR